ncbi:MAG: hypothetical protein R3C03_02525 [Pirellulaceae bacterium]
MIANPYAFVSSVSGPVWFFYGIGQIWLTHEKSGAIDGWQIRLPRVRAKQFDATIQSLKEPLTSFVQFCNEHQIEGTIVLEQYEIEFHWLFGQGMKGGKQEPQLQNEIEKQFAILAEAFCSQSIAQDK